MSAVATRLAGVRARGAWLVVAALAVLVALPFLGRWEEHRNASVQNERMAAVFRVATASGLVSKRLYAYRLGWTSDCLVYSDPRDASATNALELCFDANGRLVETIDRRSGTPKFASLQEQPSLATLRVPVPRLLTALSAAHAFKWDPRLKGFDPHSDALPMRNADLGAYHFPANFKP